MSGSIDGLGSGLDTTTIVAQLMQIEQQPQARLASQRLGVLSRATAWNLVGVGLKGISTAATALVTNGVTGGVTGTSSVPTTATVTTAVGAQAGTHTLSVQALATAGSYGMAVASPTTTVGAGSLLLSSGTSGIGVSGVDAGTAANGTYSLQVTSVTGSSADIVVNGVASTVDTSGGSFSANGLTFSTAGLTAGKAEVTVARTTSSTSTVADLAAQLNSAHGVASASVITATDPGTGVTSTRLLLSARDTGSLGALTTSTSGLSDLGAQSTVRAAQDASFTLDGLAGITRSSNTVGDVLPGVTLGLVSAGPSESTLTVAPDSTAATTAVKALVDALNSTLGTITSNTKYDIAAKRGQPLTGDSAVRQLSYQLHDVVSQAGAGTVATLGQMGIKLQDDGTYAFDGAAFSAELGKDPAAATALVTKLASGLKTLADPSLASTGLTATSSASATAEARRMQDQIDQMSARLTLTEARIRKQFTDLDSALGSLKSQGSWLTSQLANL